MLHYCTAFGVLSCKFKRLLGVMIFFYIINVLYFVFQCFIFLDDAQGVADILEKLIKDNEVSGIDHYYRTDK